ncbi:hypothetical protein [Rhodomicrobium lacus]|jgi:O6-methylguanine-DNA--protein-cysteine methyltransferase|uniref:hypothetical protein n=1 Tax=Rhodomicrobium TaxID=1068 RepID=UPI0026E33FCE|nr:hypothetical protein [Rhodomicrobium lacus]WKW50700.1 hypothetical protein QMO75_15725 [Rhodomicrobium lacus]
MTRDDTILRERLARAEEEISNLQNAAAKAADRLAKLYEEFQIRESYHDWQYVLSAKVGQVRTMRQIAKDLSRVTESKAIAVGRAQG